MTPAGILIAIDEFLLDRVFQPLTDRLGERPSAFDVGISLELGAVVLQLAANAAEFAIGRLSWEAGIWNGFSCACGMWFYAFMVRHRTLIRPGAANPLRLMYRSMRLLALAFTVWSVVAATSSDRDGALSYALNAVSNLAFVAGMYLISCQPRPPGWRRAQRQAPLGAFTLDNTARQSMAGARLGTG